jgi:hypothetical protein
VATVTEGFKSLYGKDLERAELGRAANAAGLTGTAHRRDLIIGHLAPGEIVVPPQALSPAVMAALRQELGDQLPRFIVGSGFERCNPISGLPAFSPENEDDNEGFFDSIADWVDGLTGFLRSRMQRGAGGPPLGAPSPQERLGREPASRALDPFGLRDEVPRDIIRNTSNPRGGGHKCTPLDRTDPFSACYQEPRT